MHSNVNITRIIVNITVKILANRAGWVERIIVSGKLEIDVGLVDVALSAWIRCTIKIPLPLLFNV